VPDEALVKQRPGQAKYLGGFVALHQTRPQSLTRTPWQPGHADLSLAPTAAFGVEWRHFHGLGSFNMFAKWLLMAGACLSVAALAQ
jgi:hypothetical protein